MSITLNPSKLLVGADTLAKANTNAAAARTSSKLSQSRTDFDESLPRGKRRPSAGRVEDKPRAEMSASDKRITKAAKSTKRRPQRADGKTAERADNEPGG